MRKIVYAAIAGLSFAAMATGGAQAATIVTELNPGVSVSGGTAELDLDGNGVNDVRFTDISSNRGIADGLSGEGTTYFTQTQILGQSRPSGDPIFVNIGEGNPVGPDSASPPRSDWFDMTVLYDDAEGLELDATGPSYIGFKIDRFEIAGGGGAGAYIDTLFSWAEISRGSIIITATGFNDEPGQAAGTPEIPTTTVVPLPGALPLLLVGLGGFALARRRT